MRDDCLGAWAILYTGPRRFQPVEINFNRYFYRYTPPRPLEAIEAEIRGLGTEIMQMMGEVTGSR